MSSPPTWLAGPRSTDEAATGRRAAKANRKAARRKVQASVISQCDTCGATDDAEHRIGLEVHESCGGRFRMHGHVS